MECEMSSVDRTIPRGSERELPAVASLSSTAVRTPTPHPERCKPASPMEEPVQASAALCNASHST